ncbi:acyltransferase [Sulfurimonas sp. SAG-AH-194-I05]|nr:acyltransferase [Sulfurimonas sp. SAG-AH-194-I05]MDF1874426.1 acyltransferase [Sulfurimonas sp. SAG-AH-194-I05]
MNAFSFIQKLRNKLRITNGTTLILGNKINIVHCTITIKGKNNTLKIGNNTKLRNTNIEIIGNNNTIKIGENSLIGNFCYLSAKEENITLTIGNNTALSRNIKVMTSDGHPIYQNNKRINYAKDITINNNIWIADNVTILKGVEIGSNSVIGINSTVVKNITSGSVAVGNPCTVIKENIRWEY